MFSFEHIIVLLRDYWDVFLLEGLRYTLILSAIAVLFGAVFGSLIAFGGCRTAAFFALSAPPIPRWCATPLFWCRYIFLFLLCRRPSAQ